MIKRRKFLKILAHDFGVKPSRHGKGSHEIFERGKGWAVIHVCDEIPEGTMYAILDELKIDKSEFKKRLK